MPNVTCTDPSPVLCVHDCGLAPYRPMWDFQLSLFRETIARKQTGLPVEAEHIIFVEHHHVYTLGRHGKPQNMLLDPSTLASRGIELVQIERGGDITYHGPGQLVVYPIIDLQAHRLGVRDYIDLLEEAVIRTLADFGITGVRVPGATGVWLDPNSPHERKICAIGVKCSRFVTMHGLALNVNTDLSMFSAINPCGFIDKGVTSMAAELGHALDLKLVKQHFLKNFISSINRI